jgi:hypothetical protein
VATYWNGIGGSVLFGDGAGGFAEWPTIDWTLTCTNRVWEASNSVTGASAAYRRGMNEYAGSFNMVFDSDQVIDDVAVEGDSVIIEHDLGMSGMFYSQTAVIETIVPKLNTRTGGIEMAVTWKGDGILTFNAALLTSLKRERSDREFTQRPRQPVVRHPLPKFRHQVVNKPPAKPAKSVA